MLFNSYLYILLFLPLTIFGYFTLCRLRLLVAAKSWLVFASLAFYSYWNPIYLTLILASMLVNYAIGSVLSSQETDRLLRSVPRKAVLIAAVVANLSLLGYYKYADFFLKNFNTLTGSEFQSLRLILPLAISFFTFQQIAYLVDSFKRETVEYDFLNYCLFVTFFPQLIAGPIVHHKEMMPQFARTRNAVVNWKNVCAGLLVFSLGLFKKVILADSFAVWATVGFDQALSLNFFEAWLVSLSYTLQLYYDFSGYTDMAIGSALLFNIRLPLNFNSPYKAGDIQDFWRRWHMTLSRWLRDYLYVPLGGNRKGPVRTYVNLFLTFLLGGLWHGAGWTFVLWGAMHGGGTAFHKFWQTRNLKLPRWAGWSITLLFVHCAWVFFRAQTFDDAVKVFRGMFGFGGIVWPDKLLTLVPALQDSGLQFGEALQNVGGGSHAVFMVVIFCAVALFGKNSMELADCLKPSRMTLLFALVMFLFGVLRLSRITEFLYFNF